MLFHYQVLLWVAIIAASLVLLDEVIESYFMDNVSVSDKQLERNFAGFWKERQQGRLADIPAHSTLRLQEHYVTIPLDHANLNEGYYQNRYWIVTEFYTAGGPVFIHDIGELDAELSAHTFLEQASSYLRQLMRDYHGIGIIWEHRYYGKSLPFQINESTSPEHFRYLNLKQSLADLPYFAWNFEHPDLHGFDLTPRSTPWIMLGCSYSGMRAASSRELFPSTFHAAYAASAPVQLTTNLNTFFDPIQEELTKKGYSNCTKDLNEAMRYLDVQLSMPHSAAETKKLFLGPGAETNNNGDFALAIANIYSFFQTSGTGGGGKQSLNSLCNYLEADLISDQDSYPHDQGLAARYGARSALERLASWPELVPLINSHFDTACTLETTLKNPDCNLGKTHTNGDAISWMWQLCSELGLFTTQNAGPHALVSRYLSTAHHQSLCTQQFHLAQSTGLLPNLPITETINNKTKGQQMRPSNTLWTAGQYDPWRSLTPLAATDQTTISQNISICNTQTETGSIFGYVMEDAQHCLDFSTDSEEAAKATQLFTDALRLWLPCFRGGERPDSFLPWD